VVEKLTHAGELAVGCRRFTRFADREEEEGKKTEDIGKEGVDTVGRCGCPGSR
jgi:hypothetical protein